MRHVFRYGSALVLGASLTLGACGPSESANQSTATAEGGLAGTNATTGTGADSMAAVGAGAASVTANGTVNNEAMADLAGMKAEDQLALIGASNAAEIVTSKSAEPKLTNAEAKKYARDMQAEHKTMQGMADKLATQLNLTPGDPEQAKLKTDKANSMAQQLNTSPKGEALDRQYIDGQVLAHQQTLNELQAMQNTQNAEIKNLVTQAIPKVQMHLERAQRIQASLGGGSAAPRGAMDAGATGAAAAPQGSMSSSAPR